MKNDKIDEKVLNSIYKDLEKDMGRYSKPLLERNKKIMTGSLNKKVTDNDLLTLMTKRLNLIETQLSESNKLVKSLNIANVNLKNELEANKQGRCLKCEEYENIMKNQETEKLPKRIDIAQLIRKIEEMNIEIMEDHDHATFEKADGNIFNLKHLRKELKFYFYKNGLAIENYSFYEYSTKEAKKILKDILDAFTPYLLKSEYPNGVILIVENKIQTEYNKQSDIKFKNDKLTPDEFINKFPEKYIKNGEIHNLKEGIEKHLLYKRNTDDYYDKDEINLFENEANNDMICKFKIQVELLNKVITVNVLKSDKFCNLFDFLKKRINADVNIQFLKIKDIKTYLLYSNYPLQKFEYSESKSFEECGLFPSYFLIFSDINKFNK